MPVLVTNEGVFAQSEWIIRYADGLLPPERACSPARSSSSAAGSTPASARTARRLIYKHMLPRTELMLPYNNQASRLGRRGR